MLPRSEYMDYYGLKVYYRFEDRKNGLSLCLSFYDTWTEPEREKRLDEAIIRVQKATVEADEQAVVQENIPKLLKKAFNSPGSQVLDEVKRALRIRCFPHLPLAAIVECDTEAIISFKGWKDSYAAELREGLAFLTEHFGRYLLDDLKPIIVADALLTISERKATNVIRGGPESCVI